MATRNHNCRALKVCGTRFELRGRWTDRDGHGRLQTCACTRARAKKSSHRRRTWPGFDFNTVLELCYCCGAEALWSGIRWSTWFCRECQTRIDALNRHYGATLIPIGRHTAMARIMLTGIEAQKPGGLDGFMKGVQKLERGIDRLQPWARTIVAENLRVAGWPTGKDVPVRDYLRATARLPVDKAKSFERLRSCFQSQRKKSP